MNKDEKLVAIEELRQAFMTMMSAMLKIPGSPMQKQQAFFRFDEGHMWMQNAILSQQEAPQGENLTELTPEQLQEAIENGANLPA